MVMLAARSYTRKRLAAGAVATTGDNAGLYVPGAESTGTVRGSLQPLTPREIDRLPEGARVRARWKLYTAVGALKPASVSGQTEPDRVTVDGVDHVVLSVESWPSATGGLRHDVAVLVLPEGGA